MTLRATGTTRIGSQEQWQISGAPPSSIVFVLIAPTGSATAIQGQPISLLIGSPLLMAVPLPTDAQGTASLTLSIPDNPQAVGARVYGAGLTIGPSGLLAANAVELTIGAR